MSISTEEVLKDTTTDQPTGSLFSGYTVLTKAMIGVGMLSLAKALGDSGWYWGMGISIVSPIMMTFSMHLLASLASDYKDTLPEGARLDLSYYKVASRLSKKSALLLEAAVVVTSFGSAVAYSVVSGMMIAELCKSNGLTFGLDSNTLTVFIKIVIGGALSPLCFLKEIRQTTIPNALAILCLLYIVCFAMFKSEPFGPQLQTSTADMISPKSWAGIICSFPKFIFAYCCAQNLFGVANETAKFNVKRLDAMAFLATSTAIIFNTVCSIFPFMTFGRDVYGNFLKNYASDNSPATQIVRIAAVFQVCVGFVLVLHPLRASFIGMAQRVGLTVNKSELFVRYVAAAVAVIAALGTAIGLGDDLGIVIDMAGLLGANTMCFVVPCYLYCITRDRTKEPITWYASAILLFVGFVLYPVGIYGVVAAKE